MGALATSKTSPAGKKVEIDVQELILRLRSIAKGCNIEIVRLAIATMLDEIKDAAGHSRFKH
jgi:hypothetical protein